MDTCHYCCDTIDKFSDDYDKLYKELKLSDSIIKKNNFHNVICEIDRLYEWYQELEEDEPDGVPSVVPCSGFIR